MQEAHSTCFSSCCVFVLTDISGNKALENITTQDQKEQIKGYTDKLAVIKEVLARRHMKVAFFGRLVYLLTRLFFLFNDNKKFLLLVYFSDVFVRFKKIRTDITI